MEAFRTLTGEKREGVKQSVPGEAFAAHFERIYSKTSKSNLLGLTEEKVGPRQKLELTYLDLLDTRRY